ncbi:VOC family protein [Micromonospora sp. NPDC049679]|uniref:VOC family protein n=1 Tax=Micromonospora sp. NPDC049679 TaxID=3155920 RepID=UPI0033F66EFA
MGSRMKNVSIDCADPYVLSGFWSEALGYPRHSDDHPGDPEAVLLPPDEVGPVVLFLQVPERKTVKNRLHLDLQPTDRSRDEEVARLLDLGATQVADHRKPDGAGWVVLADPEGNEFCVERSVAERAA